MQILTITSEGGRQLLRMEIVNLDTKAATLAIMQALNTLPPLRKTRSDAGTKRLPKVVQPPEEKAA